MSARARAVVPLAAIVLMALAGCYREQRPSIPAEAPPAGIKSPSVPSKYEDNAYAMSQGKSLFRKYNCSGCHSQGGGGMGPALMDAKWLYGSTPEAIYFSIARGRPNGMPAFGERIPNDQLWQLVAYVRSMSGQVREDAAPSRSDEFQTAPPEGRREKEHPVPASAGAVGK